MIFNQDMDARIIDLWLSVERGEVFKAEFHGAFHGLPDRLVYDLAEGRRFALDLDMSRGLAAQLQENGKPAFAAPILAVLP